MSENGPSFGGTGVVLTRPPSLKRFQQGPRRFKIGDMRGDGRNDRACKLFLRREDIFELPVIPLSPTESTGIGINKPRTDPNSPSRRARYPLGGS
jgi:hypothetical protein